MTTSKTFFGLGSVTATIAAGTVLLGTTDVACAMPGPGRPIAIATPRTNGTNNNHTIAGAPALAGKHATGS
jgi:hypothetical protein